MKLSKRYSLRYAEMYYILIKSFQNITFSNGYDISRMIITLLKKEFDERTLYRFHDLKSIMSGSIASGVSTFDTDEEEENDIISHIMTCKKLELYNYYDGLSILSYDDDYKACDYHDYILVHTHDNCGIPDVYFKEWLTKYSWSLDKLEYLSYTSRFSEDENFSWYRKIPNLQALDLSHVSGLRPEELNVKKLSLDFLNEQPIQFLNVKEIDIVEINDDMTDYELISIIEKMFPNVTKINY